MKKVFETAEAELIKFEVTDIITASNPTGTGEGGSGFQPGPPLP